MRERLDVVSSSIAKALTKIDWEAEKAPISMRISARAAAAEIANTQEWLRQRLALLPFDPQQRYLVMQDLLQSQFVALEKITSIVQDLMMLRDRPVAPEYLPPGMRSLAQILPPLAQPRAPEQPFTHDFSARPGTPYATELPGQAAWSPQGPAHFAWDQPAQYAPPHQAPVHLADLEPVPQTSPSRAHQTTRRKAGRSNREEDDEESGRASTLRLVLRTTALLGAIAVAAGSTYMAYGRWSAQKQAARPVASKSERVAIGDPSARSATQRDAGAPPVRRIETGPTRVPSPPPMSEPPIEEPVGGPLPGVMLTSPSRPPPATASPPPLAPATSPPARISATETQFVPLIATHRDRSALMAMLADLRRQYPGIIGKRQSEAQAVNFGDKGVWHQLILLPPVPRHQAAATCEELRAAGYARCSVRPF